MPRRVGVLGTAGARAQRAEGRHRWVLLVGVRDPSKHTPQAALQQAIPCGGHHGPAGALGCYTLLRPALRFRHPRCWWRAKATSRAPQSPAGTWPARMLRRQQLHVCRPAASGTLPACATCWIPARHLPPPATILVTLWSWSLRWMRRRSLMHICNPIVNDCNQNNILKSSAKFNHCAWARSFLYCSRPAVR